jgi:hypothetical protein
MQSIILPQGQHLEVFPAPIDRVLAALLQGMECIASSSQTLLWMDLHRLTQLALIDHITSINLQC